MRLVGRHDVSVSLGLVAAALLIVLNPLSRLAGAAAGTPARFALALAPGLALLVAILAIDRWRRAAAVRAAGVRADAEAGRAAAAELERERLAAFVRALARAVDAEGITAALDAHLAPIVGARLSVLLSRPTGWEVYAGDRNVADDLLARGAPEDTERGPAPPDREIRVPLRTAGQIIGLLVAPRPPAAVDPAALQTVEAAAAGLAVAIRNLQLFRELHENSLRDPLTGCMARAHGLEIVDAELRRARRSQQPVSLIVVDVDHLKDVNSRHGYQCGDAVLAAVGRRLREALRRSDLKCRYGGEEFVILLPETALIGARRVAETIRREIADRPLPWNGDELTVTASLGVTQVLPGEVNVGAVIARAEAAVRRAQQEGHNTVRVASDALESLQQGRWQERQ